MSGRGAGPNAETAGRMVEEVLDRIASAGDRAACESAEELVRVLMEFYGAAFARAMDLLRHGPDRPAREAVAALLRDELVGGLLVLHGLHPEDVPARIAHALDALPQSVESTGFDPATGELRLRLLGSEGCGCGGSREAVEQAARDTLACLAPEVTAVTVEADTPGPVLLQIGSGPPGASPSAPDGRPPATTAP